jgi:hypothetical protein
MVFIKNFGLVNCLVHIFTLVPLQAELPFTLVPLLYKPNY